LSENGAFFSKRAAPGRIFRRICLTRQRFTPTRFFRAGQTFSGSGSAFFSVKYGYQISRSVTDEEP
jgi:hypothetical protein